jgi:hypothetical protein
MFSQLGTSVLQNWVRFRDLARFGRFSVIFGKKLPVAGKIEKDISS